MDEPVNDFILWLNSQGYASRTVEAYSFWYNKWAPKPDDLQAQVQAFCETHKSCPSRAMVRCYLLYRNRMDVRIPEIRGRRPSKLPKYLNYEEIQTLIRYCEANDLYKESTLIRLMFEGGLRIDEAVHVRVRDIDFETGKIRGKGKGNKDFVILFSEDTAKRLQARIDKRHLSPGDRLIDDSRNVAYNHITKAAKAALGKHVNPHQLRHSCATWMLENKFELREIQSYMRHANLNTTGIYLHVSRQKIEERLRDVWSQASPAASTPARTSPEEASGTPRAEDHKE